MVMKSRILFLLLDLRRSWGILFLSAAGILLTAGLAGFFLGFYQGVEKKILPAYVPLDRLELRKDGSHIDLGPLRLGLGAEGMSTREIEELARVSGVRAAYPSLSLGLPAIVSGGRHLLGQDFITEAAVQGLDPDLVQEEISADYNFEKRPEDGTPCFADSRCPQGQYCGDTESGQRICRPPIPAIISPRLIRLFNLGIRKAYGLPKINPESLIGLQATISFGASTLSGAGRGKIIRDHLQLVGFSDRVSPIGIAIPIGEVRDVQRRFGAGETPEFDTAVLLFRTPSDLADAAPILRKMGYRSLDSSSEKLSSALRVARILMLSLAGVIFLIAGLGLFHAFSGLLQRRKEEIRILRVIGASARDIFALMVIEAGLASLAGGLLGIALGVSGGMALEFLAKKSLGEIPLMPSHFFLFEWGSNCLLLVLLVVFGMAAAAFPTLVFLRRPAEPS